VTLDDDIGALARHWPELPTLAGDKWVDIEPEVRRLLTALRMAQSDERRNRLASELVALLLDVPEVRERVPRESTKLHAGATWPMPLESLPALLAISERPRSRRRRGEGGTGSRSIRDPAASGEALLRRTPHLDIPDEPVEPGASFTVSVYVDSAGLRPGESGMVLLVPDRPETSLDVWLSVTEHFTTDGNSRPLVIRREDERSADTPFEVRAVHGAARLDGEPGIGAFFTHDGRPAGSVQRVVPIRGHASETRDRAAPLPEPVCAVDPDAHRPDLTVEITRLPDDPDRHFVCRVSTPLLPDWAEGEASRWTVLETTHGLVTQAMGLFTAALAEPAQRRARLVAAGRQLFRAAPKNFQDAYWALVDADAPLRTIYITSAEPYLPWELMIPNDAESGREQELPLGVEYVVGRWVHRQNVSHRQGVPMDDAYVVAPRYREGRALAHSPREAELVCSAFAGTEVRPALIAVLDATVNERCPALLHFVGHGVAKEDGSQFLELDPDEVLSETELEGWSGLRRGFAAKAPFVFLNACDIGRQAPALALGEAGGFAAAFIALGARCVVAPIWSVEDSVAATVARDFYKEVEDSPERPFAEILCDLRRRAYEGDELADSYAAYTFFGDPLAARAPPEP